MAIPTFSMRERKDGTWVVCSAKSGRLLLIDGVLQPGLSEREAREAADLIRAVTFPAAANGQGQSRH